MSWVDTVKERIPDYAKDIKLNLDNVINRSSLSFEEATACALAAAAATDNKALTKIIGDWIENEVEKTAALTAAAVMAQNNVWYPYVEMAGDEQLKGLPAQLRMNAIGNHGGTSKMRFEAYSLAASTIGKCHFCIEAHYKTLKKEGYTPEQLRDIGRIAAVIYSVSKTILS